MEFDKTSDFFTAFRKDYGFPYFYREEPLNWFRDVGMWGVGIGYVAAVLTVTVLIALLGTRGYSRWRVTLQMIISLGIGLSIIICVTGTYWGIASYETTEGNITKKYSLRVGLNGANITMEVKDYDSDDDGDFSEYHNLKIGWVEVYQAEQEYREALLKGWPIPILKIARYISADMGGMRYMRAFRSSGYAVWVLLWTAFAVWLLSNILIGSNITYSAIFLLGTGMLKVLAVIVYSARQPDNFYIHIDDGNARPLRLMYDWMYWVTLFIGIFTILIAAIMLVLDYLRPADMNKFFGTLSEIHSPYDDELLMNKNKDIKGMIRSFSAKRPHQRGHGGGAIRRDESDVEGINKTANGRGGHVNFSGILNPSYAHSMTSIAEAQADDENSSPKSLHDNGAIPDIHVEMADMREESDQAENNKNQAKPSTSSSSSEGSDTTLQMRHPVIQRSDGSTKSYIESDDSETSLDGGDLSRAGSDVDMTLRSRMRPSSSSASTQELITEND